MNNLELKSFKALRNQFTAEGMHQDQAEVKAYELLYRGRAL